MAKLKTSGVTNIKIGSQSQNLINNMSDGLSKSGDRAFVRSLSQGIKTDGDGTNDLSAKTVSGIVQAVSGGARVFMAAQSAAPGIVKSAAKTGKGVYIAGKTAVKVVRGGIDTAVKLKTGVIKIDTNTIKTLASRSAKTVKKAVVNGVKNIKHSVKQSYRIVRGVAKGRIRIIPTSAQMRKFGNILTKNAAKLTIGGAKSAAKGAWKVTKFNIKAGSAVLKVGVPAISGAMLKSDDAGVKSIGMGIKSAELGVRGAKIGYKTVKNTVKGGVKTAKIIGRGIKSLRTVGVKKTAAKVAGKAIKAVVETALKLVRGALMKLILPAVIATVGLFILTTLSSAPIAAVLSIFGGSFSIFEKKADGTEVRTNFDTEAFLRNAVTKKRQEFAEKIAVQAEKNLVSNGGDYHLVRLFRQEEENKIAEVKTEATTAEIKTQALNSLESVNNIADVLNPLFTVIILQDYGLSPTQAQADGVIDELWDTIMTTVTEELPTEYCSENVHDDCGEIIANSDCPNIHKVYHTSYTCSFCCHRHHETGGKLAGSEGIDVFDGCDGCNHCGGHKILKIQINQDGYFALIDKYFSKPIEELSEKSTLTDDEEVKLQALQDNYALCLDLINEVQGNRTDGAGNVDLSGVEFINGERSGCQEIVDLAVKQAGNVGGETFWRGLGYNSRIEWCAAFVSWCAKECGYVPGAFSVFVSCRVGIAEFQSKGQWYSGNYDTPVAGDLIFFDWDKDGAADHVGLVAGNDGEKVYTIEGNSGDVCRSRSYSLNSGVIFGYGLPNY